MYGASRRATTARTPDTMVTGRISGGRPRPAGDATPAGGVGTPGSGRDGPRPADGGRAVAEARPAGADRGVVGRGADARPAARAEAAPACGAFGRRGDIPGPPCAAVGPPHRPSHVGRRGPRVSARRRP